MTKAERLAGIPVTVLAGVLMFTVSMSLNGVLAGYAWLAPLSLCIGTVVLVMVLARMLRVPEFLIPLLATFSLIPALTSLFFSEHALAGLIPTSKTLEQIGTQVAQSRNAILTTVPPLTPDPGLQLLICASFSILSIIAATLCVVLNSVWVAGLTALIAMIPAAVVLPGSVRPGDFALVLLVFIALVVSTTWLGRIAAGSEQSPAPRTLLAGVLVLVLALGVPPLIPGFVQGYFPQGARLDVGQGTGLNPFVTLGADLRQAQGAAGFSYASTSAEPLYIRSNVISNFENDSWGPETNLGRTVSLRNGVELEEKAYSEQREIGAQAGIDFAPVSTEFESSSFNSSWLPSVGVITRVWDLAGAWGLNQREGTVLAEPGTSTENKRYVVDSLLAAPTPEQLNALNPEAGALAASAGAQYVQLPGDTPDLVAQRAREVVADAGAETPFDQALALQKYLRSDEFSYSVQAPVLENYDGAGMAVLEPFLQRKSGYCVHFSATMAVMGRTLGLPTRIVVGFAPQPTPEGAEADFATVNGQHVPKISVESGSAHAWPEFYFEGVGWLPFEPTPSRGVAPQWAPAEAENPDEIPLNSPSVAEDDFPELNPTQNQQPSDEPGSDPGSTPESGDGSGLSGPALIGALLMVLVLAVLGLLTLLRHGRRRVRTRLINRSGSDSGTAARAAASAAALYEARDLLLDYGKAPPGMVQAKQWAQWVATQLPPATGAAEALVKRFEFDRYAAPQALADPAELLAALKVIHDALREDASVPARIRAQLLPASLLRKSTRNSALRQ